MSVSDYNDFAEIVAFVMMLVVLPSFLCVYLFWLLLTSPLTVTMWLHERRPRAT